MNLQFYLKKLNSSKIFKKFIKENPNAYLCSGFFVIDKEGRDNKQHFDYFLPKDKKIYSFQIENKTQLVPLPINALNEKPPEKMSIDYDFDFEYVEKIITEEIKKHNIKNKIQKILFSLQKVKGRDFLIGTVFVSMLGMIKVNIDLAEKRITDFEEKSFFDMINVFKKG